MLKAKDMTRGRDGVGKLELVRWLVLCWQVVDLE